MTTYYKSSDGKSIYRGSGAINDAPPVQGGGWIAISSQERPDLYPKQTTTTPFTAPISTNQTTSQPITSTSSTPAISNSNIQQLKSYLDQINNYYRTGMNPPPGVTGQGYVEMVAAQKAYNEAIKQAESAGAPTVIGNQNISTTDALTLAKAMGATPEQINALQNKLAGGGTISSDVAVKSDTAFQNILKDPNLSNDDKTLLQKYYDTVTKNDSTSAARLLDSFNYGLEFSDPIFKAKAAIAADALKTVLGGNSTDLAFREQRLTNILDDLRANTEATKGYLDFTHTQELEKLAKSYEQDLNTVRENLAAVGKTSSSVRSRAEKLLSENNAGLVESSNRQFAYQTGQQNRTLASSERDLPLEISQLRDEANRKRIAALRTTETDLGSLGLSNLGYSGSDVLGGIPSEIGQSKIKDALNWSKLGMNFF